jgi:YgiT-type zinc finger domain-containing protein
MLIFMNVSAIFVPYPSQLVLGWIGSRAIHVVAADNHNDHETIVITTYEPSLDQWEPGFKRRISTMKCVICKQGETRNGKATVTLKRGATTLVFKGVPAIICGNCGEEYIDQETTVKLLKAAEEATRVGVQVDIREYVAA